MRPFVFDMKQLNAIRETYLQLERQKAAKAVAAAVNETRTTVTKLNDECISSLQKSFISTGKLNIDPDRPFTSAFFVPCKIGSPQDIAVMKELQRYKGYIEYKVMPDEYTVRYWVNLISPFEGSDYTRD